MIAPGASPGETKMLSGVRENSDFWTYALFFMLFCLISLHYVNGINKMMMMMMISVHIAGLPPMG